MSVLQILGQLIARLLGARQGLALDVAGLGALVAGAWAWHAGLAVLGLALLVLGARIDPPEAAP